MFSFAPSNHRVITGAGRVDLCVMPRTGTILAKFLHPRGLVTEARQRKAEKADET